MVFTKTSFKGIFLKNQERIFTSSYLQAIFQPIHNLNVSGYFFMSFTFSVHLYSQQCSKSGNQSFMCGWFQFAHTGYMAVWNRQKNIHHFLEVLLPDSDNSNHAICSLTSVLVHRGTTILVGLLPVFNPAYQNRLLVDLYIFSTFLIDIKSYCFSISKNVQHERRNLS